MDIEALNRGLFLAINAPAGLAGASLNLSIGAARYSVALLALLLAWRWLRGSAGERRVLMHVALAVVPALALNYALGLAFAHPRPFMIGLGNTLLAHRPEASFPSDHATLMWAIAIGLLFYWPTRPSSWIAVLLAALTSWARVFLGLHFPFDIVGSMAVAASVIAALAPLRVLIEARIMRPFEAIGIGAVRRFAHRDPHLQTAQAPLGEPRMNSTFGSTPKQTTLP